MATLSVKRSIEQLLSINPFFNDPTDPINHTETRPYMYMHQKHYKNLSKAQFRRRASAVSNLIVIWFDCSTARKQL